MTTKKQPPNSPQKRRRPEAQHDNMDCSPKVTRRSTASARTNTIPRSPPHTPPHVGRGRASIRHSSTLPTYSTPVDPETQFDDTPNTPQSLVRHALQANVPTIERGIARPAPPIALSKQAWAQRYAVKINRHSFNTATSSPSASSKGTKWAEVLG